MLECQRDFILMRIQVKMRFLLFLSRQRIGGGDGGVLSHCLAQIYAGPEFGVRVDVTNRRGDGIKTAALYEYTQTEALVLKINAK